MKDTIEVHLHEDALTLPEGGLPTHEEKIPYLRVSLQPWVDLTTDDETMLWYTVDRHDHVVAYSSPPKLDPDAPKPKMRVPWTYSTFIAMFSPVTEGVQYALAVSLDQTMGYLTPKDGGGYRQATSVHREAELFPDLASANAARLEETSRRPHNIPWVEAVPDETEFRARPDTW